MYQIINQSVFCRGLFLEKAKSLLDRNAFVGAVFPNLKRASDTVNQEVLLFRLTQFKFSLPHTYLTGNKMWLGMVKSTFLP